MDMEGLADPSSLIPYHWSQAGTQQYHCNWLLWSREWGHQDWKESRGLEIEIVYFIRCLDSYIIWPAILSFLVDTANVQWLLWSREWGHQDWKESRGLEIEIVYFIRCLDSYIIWPAILSFLVDTANVQWLLWSREWGHQDWKESRGLEIEIVYFIRCLDSYIIWPAILSFLVDTANVQWLRLIHEQLGVSLVCSFCARMCARLLTTHAQQPMVLPQSCKFIISATESTKKHLPADDHC